MTVRYEVLFLHDRYTNGRWHITPDIEDCIGWWPDGSPAWLDEPDYADGNRIVIDVIPKRQPIDEDWVEDHPSVLELIDMAMTLNDVFQPWPGTPLADVYASGNMEAQSRAMLARIRQSFGPCETERVLALSKEIAQMRMHPTASGWGIDSEDE